LIVELVLFDYFALMTYQLFCYFYEIGNGKSGKKKKKKKKKKKERKKTWIKVG
jgi:hypothetical protein